MQVTPFRSERIVAVEQAKLVVQLLVDLGRVERAGRRLEDLHDDRHHQEQDRQRDQHLDERHAAPAVLGIVASGEWRVASQALDHRLLDRQTVSHRVLDAPYQARRTALLSASRTSISTASCSSLATTHSPLATIPSHYSPHLTKNVCGITLTTYGQIEHGVQVTRGCRWSRRSSVCASSVRLT